jgi:hypothetical protein
VIAPASGNCRQNDAIIRNVYSVEIANIVVNCLNLNDDFIFIFIFLMIKEIRTKKLNLLLRNFEVCVSNSYHTYKYLI